MNLIKLLTIAALFSSGQSREQAPPHDKKSIKLALNKSFKTGVEESFFVTLRHDHGVGTERTYEL